MKYLVLAGAIALASTSPVAAQVANGTGSESPYSNSTMTDAADTGSAAATTSYTTYNVTVESMSPVTTMAAGSAAASTAAPGTAPEPTPDSGSAGSAAGSGWGAASTCMCSGSDSSPSAAATSVAAMSWDSASAATTSWSSPDTTTSMTPYTGTASQPAIHLTAAGLIAVAVALLL